MVGKEFVGVVEFGLRAMPDSEYKVLKYVVIIGVAIISTGLTSATLDGLRRGGSLVNEKSLL